MKLAALILLFLSAAVAAQAAGIGTAPSELHFSVPQGEKQQRTLTVYNLGSEPASINARSSASFLSAGSAGSMAAGEAAKVTVEADASRLTPGQHKATVYVTIRGAATGVGISVGTAVKATVDVIPAAGASVATGIFLSIAIVAVGLLLYFAALRLPFLNMAKA